MGKHGVSNKEKTRFAKDKDTRVKKAKSPKQNKRNKKRDVLSYENVPIKEYREYSEEEVKLDKRLIKRTAIVVGIIAVLVLFVLIFANRESLTWDNISTWFTQSVLGTSDGEDYPVEIVGTEISKGNFRMMGDYPAYASDTSYVELSDTAGEIIKTQLNFSSPVVRGTSNYNIVYGLGSNSFLINDVKKTTHKGSTKNGIFTADINSDGYYCIVTEGSGYLSVMTAYNNEYKKMYEYSFADYYITSVAINSKGSQAVCCGITSVDGAEHTKVYVLDFNKEKPVMEYDLTESVIYDIFYLSSDTVSAVANNAVYTLDLSEEKPVKEPYDSRTLTTYEYNPDTKTFVVSLSRSGDGRNCDIVFFDSSGKIDYTIKSDYKVEAISTYKGDLAILSQGKLYLLNEDGTVDSTADAGNDARSFVMCKGDKAYVFGISDIRRVEFE